jgi:phosphoribosylglycinamide formyltransferase-1
MTLNLAILISGRGSNMQAIHRATLDKKLDARIRLIVSDNPGAAGLDYAKAQGIPATVIEKKTGEDRASFDRRVMEAIDRAGVDLIALAGYMRLLTQEFVAHYPNKIVNIHPSLLPDFPGLHAQRQALAAGVPYSGCTVHFVDEGCDTGPIIDQRKVAVLPDDDEQSLSDRILVEEHKLYPEVLQKIAEGKIIPGP